MGSPEVKKQNIPRIPKIVIWRHWGQKSTFPKNSQYHHLELSEAKKQKQNFPRIPKIVIWGHQRSKSKISQEFPRL
ncbi:hypothetical protein HOLleu_11981 [Holothuria leucospilota]|uniref:Uncharacterized protein n=1 Tax=Holothuria leucospilota TaxID=206669 RepID=A0A9Q1C9I8_HOLLE|nr:hypothetical protein HOLleu_11981 [Holothuria leucospilota]